MNSLVESNIDVFHIFSFYFEIFVVTLSVKYISKIDIKINNLIFVFTLLLWCLKRFYVGLQGLHKTF